MEATPAHTPPTAPEPSGSPLLSMRGIVKSFYDVTVLHGVDLDLRAGEVHAVMGENGAGKSTLMKVLAGVYSPDEGEILIEGESQKFHHPKGAQQAGVAIIFQEFNLLPFRNVAENVFVGREPFARGVVDRKTMEADTRVLLEQLGVADSISPRSIVGRLSVAQQQTVEIVKALSLNARILVMDEPTAALSAAEVELLFDQVRGLQKQGIGVLYISHRLKEIFELADRVTVLKDGRLVGTTTPDDVTPPQLVKMMVGRELDGYFPPRAEAGKIGEPLLRLSGATTEKLRSVSVELRAGEIVGVAGLQGSGRTEIARALFGVDKLESGTLEVSGKGVKFRSPRHAVRAGMGYITEDRKAEGLVGHQSVRDNMTLTFRAVLRGKRRSDARPEGVASVQDLARSVELRAHSLEQEVRYLSGGNQQKVVVAKWLATEPRILIFDEPTRGIDVGAKAGIHDLMRSLANEGVAILMISSELPEVIGMADRVVVMRDGAVAGELPAGPTEADIILLATGQEDLPVDAEAIPVDTDPSETGK